MQLHFISNKFINTNFSNQEIHISIVFTLKTVVNKFNLHNSVLQLTLYRSLFVKAKGKLDTYTVLLLGANPPLIFLKKRRREELSCI